MLGLEQLLVLLVVADEPAFSIDRFHRATDMAFAAKLGGAIDFGRDEIGVCRVLGAGAVTTFALHTRFLEATSHALKIVLVLAGRIADGARDPTCGMAAATSVGLLFFCMVPYSLPDAADDRVWKAPLCLVGRRSGNDIAIFADIARLPSITADHVGDVAPR